MSEHPNRAAVRQAFDDFNSARNRGALLDLFHEDAVLHIGGTGPTAGVYRGKKEVQQFFSKLGELTKDAPKAHREALEYLTGAEEWALALWKLTMPRNGLELVRYRLGLLFRMRDGKAVEVWDIHEDQALHDAWLSA